MGTHPENAALDAHCNIIGFTIKQLNSQGITQLSKAGLYIHHWGYEDMPNDIPEGHYGFDSSLSGSIYDTRNSVDRRKMYIAEDSIVAERTACA